ncbi:hypothetical protein CVD28_01745 [Bacillus sp. M6-12]|uniref:hypothetical protein n=1 Tax=Bacillus sp. M6-12 TaxID=2054166 RepID=UPI000C76D895|nr:hypothetical protein [Bacillus sp. M6-12]PLS19157.1 hypothetical protein CVD28_01745 [Bacillus sp. M6-12]
MQSMEQFIEMGYEPQEVKHLLEIQGVYQAGKTVSLTVDNHTDEDLLNSIEKKQLDSNRLTIKEVEWKTGQVRFVDCEGWANIGKNCSLLISNAKRMA